MIIRAFVLIGFAVSGLAVLPHHAVGAPLRSYLQVGPYRIAFASDTLVERGIRVPLVRSTFADVSHALGPAIVSTHGDAGDALGWVCYQLAGSPHMSLLLESSEMGALKSITDFELVPAGSRASREQHCASSNVPASTVVTNTGLRLGLTRAEVNARLGLAGRDSAGAVVYDRSRDGRRVGYTQSAGYVVKFVRGRVAEFTGYRVDAS